jgi:putative glutamate/gamma-aminobutyrate antiporter
MMNIAVVMSLRGLPMMAKEGFSIVFILGAITLFFFLPSALVSAELASGWYVEVGGVYRWVREAFGQRAGFVAVFLQWIQNVIWYPVVLAFGGSALAYLLHAPNLAQDKIYTVIVILLVYWGATFLNFRGLAMTGKISHWGVLYGTMLPALVIIVLGLSWWLHGNPLEFTKHPSSFSKLKHFARIDFLTAVMMMFAGIEVSAVHVKEVENPKRNFPKAIFLSSVIIILVFFLGSLSIAAVLPREQITLTAGIMQALDLILREFNLSWMLQPIGLLVAFGTVGSIAAWIVGPSKGLFSTAKEGHLPPLLARSNQAGVPTSILLIQAVIVSFLTIVYFLMPSVSSAFFLLLVLSGILYLLMYLLLFAAAIRLRYSHPNVERTYRVPGGKLGMWIISGLGIVGSLFAIIMGFSPPQTLPMGNANVYFWFLLGGVILFIAIPLGIMQKRKKALSD